MRLLVEAGADVNAIEHDPEDDIRNTALDCCRGEPDIEQELKEQRSPDDRRDRAGCLTTR